ncbi:uncharacterized protein LOC121969578 [Zingiber officinale]|uniref:uncharacterized protein LOC121969578 n=1 Tax=Zingiber officinale TaxID=94328 RepID=UPI001C4BD08B|nr:uncharacterized protein LOC121969578 [Zingiber officinale]
MANPRWKLQRDGHDSTIWAIKISFWFLSILSFGGAARAAVPATAGALYSALPGLWASLRYLLQPPCLFIAVHFMILVIWKLSNQKQQREQWSAEEPGGDPKKIKPFDCSHSYELIRNPSPVICFHEIPLSPSTEAISSPDPAESTSSSDISCLTTDSVERSTASSAFAVKKTAEPDFEKCITEEEDEELAAALATAGIENISMEMTWKAIMQKSSLASPSPPPPPPPSSSLGQDDLTQRFDDFIKKNYEQIRLRL